MTALSVAELVLLTDVRAALAAGIRDVAAINRAVQLASTGRGGSGYPDYAVIHGLGHLTRSGEIDCIVTGHPRRWEYQPRTVHTRTADCPCGPVVIAPGVHQHRGTEPIVFVPVDGDDVASDGTTTEIHQ